MDQDTLGTAVDLGPGDITLHGDPAPPPHGKGHIIAHAPLFGHVRCGQTVVNLSNCWAIAFCTNAAGSSCSSTGTGSIATVAGSNAV